MNSTALLFPGTLPSINLSIPDAKTQLVKACEDFGFFKVTNHGVPIEFIAQMESEALRFFSLPLSVKQKVGPANPFGYGERMIGLNGDVGFLEYLLLTSNVQSYHQKLGSSLGEAADKFRCAVKNYISGVKKLACEILDMLADELSIEPGNELSKLLMDEQSDSVFRLNHYPRRPEFQGSKGRILIGFGDHTDPQIISVLSSNNTSGLEILLKDDQWIAVPPDPNSFFINVGDMLQVMSNGRLKSVRHRVVGNSSEARLSMIYFGAPCLSQKISPLATQGEEILYHEFTWFDYKTSAYNSRLGDDRLCLFQKYALPSPSLLSCTSSVSKYRLI